MLGQPNKLQCSCSCSSLAAWNVRFRIQLHCINSMVSVKKTWPLFNGCSSAQRLRGLAGLVLVNCTCTQHHQHQAAETTNAQQQAATLTCSQLLESYLIHVCGQDGAPAAQPGECL